MSIEDFISDLKKINSKGFASGGIVPVPPRNFTHNVFGVPIYKEPRKMTPRQQRMKQKRDAQKQRRLNHDARNSLRIPS